MHYRKFFLLLLIAASFVVRAQLPTGQQLLADGLRSFNTFGIPKEEEIVKTVEVTDQSFTTAYFVNTFESRQLSKNIGLKAGVLAGVHKGDVLWISFKIRSLESKRETGESFLELRFDQLVKGVYKWPSHLERGISFGKEWTETSVPFIMTKDATPEEVSLVLKFDSYPQKFEISPVTFINYGSGVSISDLPKSVVHYQGDEPAATWRKAATGRIEKYRKGDLTVKVLDKNRRPVAGASVGVSLEKIAYGWGTATNSALLLDTSNPQSKIYRDTLLKYFNKVVFENEMKSGNWAKVDHQKTLRAADWLQVQHIDIRGHVMVWPSFQHSPHLLSFAKDTALLRKTISNLIIDETRVMRGRFSEWDVVNEPFVHHGIIDALGGKEVMVDWFKLAKAQAPGVRLFLNEFTMFHDQVSSDDFYNNVKFLVDHGAPIEGIGEQSHIGGTPPGMDFIIAKLDHFASFGLPVQISEFDISSDDDDFKSAYLRDYFTAIFSHPITTGILQWGFWEGSHWIPPAALWSKDWTPKPAGKMFAELVSKTWNTQATGSTGKDGLYKVRGFNGEYEVTVKAGGRLLQAKATLTSGGKELVVQL